MKPVVVVIDQNDKCRGSKKWPSKDELNFWGENPGLLFDSDHLLIESDSFNSSINLSLCISIANFNAVG